MANDLTGQKFGRLTALKHVGSNAFKHRTWLCICECGNETIVAGISLKCGNTSSCGCLRREVTRNKSLTHGQTTNGEWSSEYHSWKDMIKRCTKPNNKSFKNYGGRGIKVCPRWMDSFDNFFADMGEKPTLKHTIERKDVNGDYTPENCKWATKIEQAWNRRIPAVNKSGVKGVHWNNRDKRWVAGITANGKRIQLGSYELIKDAEEARKLGELKYWNKKPS